MNAERYEIVTSATLASVARVPIYLAGHIHHDCQYDKERDGAHEQGVVLLSQSDLQKSVNTRQSRADHQRARTAAEEKPAVPCD